MKKFLASALAATVLMSAAMAHAGGPVIVAEEPEVVADAPASGAILPLLLIGIALCVAVLCDDDDDTTTTTTQTPPPGNTAPPG